MERNVKSIPVAFRVGNFFDFIMLLIYDLRVYFIVASDQAREAYNRNKTGSRQLQAKILAKWEKTLRSELKRDIVVYTRMPRLESTDANEICSELLEVISDLYIEELRLVKTATQAHWLFFESPACTKARVAILKKWKQLFLEELDRVISVQYAMEYSYEAPYDEECLERLYQVWNSLSDKSIDDANDKRELKVLKYYLPSDDSVQKHYLDRQTEISAR